MTQGKKTDDKRRGAGGKGGYAIFTSRSENNHNFDYKFRENNVK